MDMRWSLEELYSSFDSPEFKADFTKIDLLIDQMKKWAKENLASNDKPKEKIEYYINTAIEFANIFSKLMTYANLRSSVDARDQDALKFMDKLEVKYNELTQPS